MADRKPPAPRKPAARKTTTARKTAARKPTTLRAVGADETGPTDASVDVAKQSKAASMTVTQAAANGTTRDLLVALQNRVATAVENPNTPARDLAALTKRLMEIDREIEAIDARAAQEAKDDAAEVEDGDFDASAV